MERRKILRLFGSAALATQLPYAALARAEDITSSSGKKKGVMLMNRIAPSISQLYIANLDGTNERKLLGDTAYEYNGSLSTDRKWLLFTSERRGDGQSDIYRAKVDGSDITPLVATDAMDDAAALSPDGRTLAFVSTRNGYRANIWLQDIASGRLTQLTGIGQVKGKEGKPDSYLRPSWSADGKWLAFSSDRNTEWTGHDHGQGWEHTQELSIYVIRPNGTGFRKVASKPGYCLGSPQWSPNGKRVVFYEMTVEATWGARRPNYVGKAYSQIVSVDVASGARVEHTSGTDLKLQPHYISDSEIGYLIKYGPNEGLAYTSGRAPFKQAFIRSPSWSADGESVIYEKVSFKPVRPLLKQLFSWDADWDYRHIDVYPLMSRDGWIAFTDKQTGNSSIYMMRPDGSQKRKVFESEGHGLDVAKVRMGLAGAFQPCWSPDGEWLAFGLGYWFAERNTMTAALWRVRRDGSAAEPLTDGTLHSGFPSYSSDGKELVYRVWSDKEKGLRVLNIETRKSRVLTEGIDNLPGWSPDGKRIVFTRRRDDGNYDVYTIHPDGTGLFRCTDHESSDGHAVWTADGRIMWSGSQHGFRDEAALYDQTFQQYGQIYSMNADGTNKRMLTDSKWEDSMPLYLP
jgi:Tol biopolymer transport system component